METSLSLVIIIRTNTFSIGVSDTDTVGGDFYMRTYFWTRYKFNLKVEHLPYSLAATITTDCVGLLVRELEAGCGPALTAMTKLGWAGREQSQYVTSLVTVMRATVPRIRDALQTSRKFFTRAEMLLKVVTYAGTWLYKINLDLYQYGLTLLFNNF